MTISVNWFMVPFGPMTKKDWDYKMWEIETMSYMPDYITEEEDDFMSYSSIDVI